MAEVKNLFLKSKMNQDLDDRLVPSGEYRQAHNVMISRSEGSDVGALENVLGNDLITSALLSAQQINPSLQFPTGIDCIGYFSDETNNRVFLFLTNYTDTSFNNLSHPALSLTSTSIPTMPSIFCAVTCYNMNTKEHSILTQGVYLNFSKNSIITGVNVLENLLFWTDNRNQPRKLNISQALNNPDYYTTEDQVSVAKYYPYNPIRLWAMEDCQGIQVPQPQMKNKSDETNPINYGQNKYDVLGNPTNPNPTYDPNFPGDPAFLEDKFVRFSYRFKYDDNEVSLMAPFTQTGFIPKQDGYFILNLPDRYVGVGDGIDSTQEDTAYKSTVVNFMENKVDSINLYIDLPCPANQLGEKLKIKSLEILYKESEAIAVKVLKEIKIDDEIFNSTESFINWEYQSNKPIKVLPESDTTRVNDKIPVRALAQEIIGNRVVYGNITTSNDWPNYIDYKVGVSEKLNTNVTPPSNNAQKTTARVAYPNHSLKQNRNYQVGIVLSDRYGRQSPVILSPPKVKEEIINGITFKNSTIFHPYREKGGEDILYWVGDSLKLLFNNPIEMLGPAHVNKGLYSEETNPLGWYSYKVVVKQTETDYYNVYLPGMLDGYLEYTADSVINTIAHSVLINDNINKVPRDLREVGPTQSTFGSSVRLFGRVNNIATKRQVNPLVTPYSTLTLNQPYNTQYYPDSSADSVVTIGTLFDMGMGQTKTVISSHQGAIKTVTGEGDLVYVKDYSTNIFDNATVLVTSGGTNTIPTGALVKNYRENPDFRSDGLGVGTEGMKAMFNIQAEEYPFDIASKAALTFTNATFYNAASNPLIVRMSTQKGLGSYVTPGPEQTLIVLPELAVMETSPVESNLDIYWETSTSGLISDLNAETAEPFGPRDIGPEWRFVGTEGTEPPPPGPVVQANLLLADDIYFVDQLGSQVPGALDVSNSHVIRNISPTLTETLTIGNSASDFFSVYVSGSSPNPRYNFFLNPSYNNGTNDPGAYFNYLEDYATSPYKGNLSFILTFTPDASTGLTQSVTLQEQAQVGNIDPKVTLPNFDDRPAFKPYSFPNTIYMKNGTSNPNWFEYTKQVNLSLSSQVDILDPFTQVTTTSGSNQIPLFEIEPVINSTNNSAVPAQWRLKLNAGGKPGTYTLIFTGTDANNYGGQTNVQTTINLLEPGLEGSISRGTIQYGIWSGHIGYFTHKNIDSSNSTSSIGYGASNCTYGDKPKQLAPIPSMFTKFTQIDDEAHDRGWWTGPLGRWLKNLKGLATPGSWKYDPNFNDSISAIMDWAAPYQSVFKNNNSQTYNGQGGNPYDSSAGKVSLRPRPWPFYAGVGMDDSWGTDNWLAGGSTMDNVVYGEVGAGGDNKNWNFSQSNGANNSNTNAPAPWFFLNKQRAVNSYVPNTSGCDSKESGFSSLTPKQASEDSRFQGWYSIDGLAGSSTWPISYTAGGGGVSWYGSSNAPGVSERQQLPKIDFIPRDNPKGWRPAPLSSYRGIKENDGFDDPAVSGLKLGWGYDPISTGSDNWEGQSKSDTDNGYLFTCAGAGRGSNGTIGGGGDEQKTKVWNVMTGNYNCLSVGANAGMKYKIGGTTYTYSTAGNGLGDNPNEANTVAWLQMMKFRNRTNLQIGKPGISEGTALIRICVDFWNYDTNSSTGIGNVDAANTNCMEGAALFSNFLIQYRESENAPWEEAQDIYGDFMGKGLWDSNPVDNDAYGKTNALFSRGTFTTKAVRNNVPNIPIGGGASGGGVAGSNTGLIPTGKYDQGYGHGYYKNMTDNRGTGVGKLYVWTKQGTANGEFPNGIGIRNYTNSDDQTLVNNGDSVGNGQAYAEICFAVNRKGDYRFVFDNLRQGIKSCPERNETYASTWGSRPLLMNTVIAGRSIGPGVSVQVHDLYNQVPINRVWGKNAPSAPFQKGPFNKFTDMNQVNYLYDNNKKAAPYVWYAYIVNTSAANQTRIQAVDFPNNWDPENNQYTYLFAKEPVFRYVSRFYTRIAGGTINGQTEYIYSPWLGGGQTSWYAFSKRYVSNQEDTIPDSSEVGNNTTWNFPEQAGVPYGDERAYGPVRSTNGSEQGLYHTWSVQVEGNTGTFLTRPMPTSYLDLNDGIEPYWYPPDCYDFTSGPNDATTQQPWIP